MKRRFFAVWTLGLLLGLCAACACPTACAETVGLVELVEDGYLIS